MALLYHITILQDILYCPLIGLLHRMLLPRIDCQRHCLYVFLSLPNNQQPCDLFYHSRLIPRWSGAFFQYYFHFCLVFVSPKVWRSVAVLDTLVVFTLEELAIIVFHHFFPIEFSARTLSSASSFYSVFLPFNSVFQNLRNSLFKYLKYIWEIFTLK